MEKQLQRSAIYFTGMIFLSLGIALNTQTGLGVSPPLSIAFVIADLTNISIGDITLVIYCLFVFGEFILLRRNFHLSNILQIPFSIVFTRLINFYNYYLQLHSDSLLKNFCILLIAIILTGTGAAMMISMRLIPNPGDGLVLAISDTTHHSLGFTKNIFDIANVAIAAIVGFLFHTPFCGIGIGTLLSMFGIGRTVSIFNYFFQDRLHSIIAES